ncbi:thymidine kinase [bacterium]|nr:thymidine kinase [bacterium]NBX98647.1 thymidine kinase [bacterium]NDC94084.1 thymidine kinase [bacterium]NDD83530.1 thymidine kinase [bacterium]NDG29331.1 thymidine kinase [bacterium]
MAKLYFRYGAMNSGKSTAVLQVAYNYEERAMHVLLIKPAIDTKGNDQIVSRLGATRRVDILATPELDIFAVIAQHNKDVEKISCVIADEAQFFTAQQIDELLRVTTGLQIPVICYGIRTDFQTKLFSGSIRLFELAHTLEELKTICRCGKKALFNGRKINGSFVFTGSQVAIDGNENIEYESLCATCYTQFKHKS